MAKEKDKSKPKVVKMTDAEEKKKALESVFSVIEKEYGTGSIMKLGDANSVDVEVIPTGSLTLDMALGVGGLPRGRVIEIYNRIPVNRLWILPRHLYEAVRLT